jgi:hypothetical protein
MAVAYDAFVNAWKGDMGSRAESEGWGKADPNDELRRRFGIDPSVSNQQMQNYFQQNGLPDPKSPGGIGEFLKPLAFIAGSALGGPVGGSIAAANGSGASSDMGIPGWAQAAGQIAGTAYSGGLNTGGTASGTPQGFGDGGAGVGMSSAATAQSGNPFATGSFWDRSTAMGPTMGNTISDASPVTASMGGGASSPTGSMDMYGSGNMATGSNGVMTNDTIFGGTGSNPMAGAGGGIWNQVQDFFQANPLAKSIGGTGLQMLGMGILSKGSGNAAGASNNAPGTRALTEPERAQYQARLSQLVSNPSQYLSNDPFASSLAPFYKNNVIPRNVAQSGNPASVLDQQGSQFANAIAGNYNQQIQNLGGLGGFNMGPSGYAPLAYSNNAGNATQYKAQMPMSLGNLLGSNMGQQPAAGTGTTTGIFGTKVS